MKAISNVLAIVGIVLAIYAVVGRFVGTPTISLGIAFFRTTTVLLVSNTLLLLAILLKLTK